MLKSRQSFETRMLVWLADEMHVVCLVSAFLIAAVLLIVALLIRSLKFEERDIVIFATQTIAAVVGTVLVLSIAAAAVDEWWARRHPNRFAKPNQSWRKIA